MRFSEDCESTVLDIKDALRDIRDRNGSVYDSIQEFHWKDGDIDMRGLADTMESIKSDIDAVIGLLECLNGKGRCGI